MVPSFTLRESGSKSHFGSGFGVAASANKVENGVENPRAMFLQKSAPTAVGALNVAGSHSSSATTCAILVGASGCIAAASTRQEMTKPIFIRVRFIAFSFSEFQNFQRTVRPKAAVLGIPQRLTDGPSAKRDRRMLVDSPLRGPTSLQSALAQSATPSYTASRVRARSVG